MRRKLVRYGGSMLSAIALTLGLSVAAAPAQALVTTNPCDFGVVIGVRGTSAPAGSTPTISGRLWTQGGNGDQVQPIVNRLKQHYAMPFAFFSLNYPATAADYDNSVAIGTQRLVDELNFLSTACGVAMPAVVLVGHSQGADVILKALSSRGFAGAPSLSANAQMMVQAAVVLGDPRYYPGDAFNAPSNSATKGGIFIRNPIDTNNLTNMIKWGWPPENGTAPGPVQKIRSYCHWEDFFCASGVNANSLTIHNSYTGTTTDRAVTWIEHMLTIF